MVFWVHSMPSNGILGSFYAQKWCSGFILCPEMVFWAHSMPRNGVLGSFYARKWRSSFIFEYMCVTVVVSAPATKLAKPSSTLCSSTLCTRRRQNQPISIYFNLTLVLGKSAQIYWSSLRFWRRHSRVWAPRGVPLSRSSSSRCATLAF